MSLASIFRLAGSWIVTPAVGAPSGDPDIPAIFTENVDLIRKHYDEYELVADAAEDVEFGGLDSASVVIIKCPARKVLVTLTTAGGVGPSTIPVEEFAILISLTDPYIEISLTRVTGVDSSVRIFLGQRVATPLPT